jgi:hypothetical protein
LKLVPYIAAHLAAGAVRDLRWAVVAAVRDMELLRVAVVGQAGLDVAVCLIFREAAMLAAYFSIAGRMIPLVASQSALAAMP